MSEESPGIESLAWGKITVVGHGLFKDVKLYPGGARAWDWNETGTRHEPGIQIADVQELLERGVDAVVLSKGMHERLQTRPETLAMLESCGVEVHVLQTEQAVAKYEELRATLRVGALIHSTC